MSFTLPMDAPLGKSLSRLGVKQLGKAMSQLTPEVGDQTGVHGARKCFKRFRSLLLLARPGLDREVFARYNTGVRDIARCFSTTRDRQAMCESVSKIEAEAPPIAVRTVVTAAKTALKLEPDAAGVADHRSQQKALAQLKSLKRDFRSVSINVEHFSDMKKGLIAVYDDGRSRMHGLQARAGVDGEAFHDWRKSVQRHWRHLQLLTLCWPAAIQEQVRQARTLSQLLGDDQDLSVLQNFAVARHASLGSKSDVAEFLAFCVARQATLRAAAEANGRRLFAEKPGAIARRLAAYWEAGPIATGSNIETRPAMSQALVLVK
ncbi:MAG: CHAD domain-containing protein [Hyphomicrobiales bacterium]|nr:CHAD domain-containing protein [Hyphomicrobiales bacterium]